MNRERDVLVPDDPRGETHRPAVPGRTGTAAAGPDHPDVRHRHHSYAPTAPTALTALAAFHRRHSLTVLRVCVGALFLWFGATKFLPGAGTAEDMATRVMSELTLGRVPAELSQPLLATLEVLIGVGLVTGLLPRLTLLVFFGHMAGTFTALVVLPAETWNGVALPTLAGQYVIKNIVLVAAGLTIAAHAPRPTATTGRAAERRNGGRGGGRGGGAGTGRPAGP
ncbi:DoxX family protein [Streptomyces taklimakanensis]|uniref:DoxX family protein n=1 Tax=Streptomyces taklimakanensis TaxID=2569853 RepID=UPI003083F90E